MQVKLNKLTKKKKRKELTVDGGRSSPAFLWTGGGEVMRGGGELGGDRRGAREVEEACSGVGGGGDAWRSCCGSRRRRRRRQLRREIAGGTGDEKPRGKAEKQEGDEGNPGEVCLGPFARRNSPPTWVAFGRPEKSGDGGGRRLLRWGARGTLPEARGG